MACYRSAAGSDVILRLDIDLNSVNWSESEVNQNDFVGDNIARQVRYGFGMVCIRLKILFLREYR